MTWPCWARSPTILSRCNRSSRTSHCPVPKCWRSRREATPACASSAAPDAPPVDVYLNDAQIAQGLTFGTATEYVTVPSGGDRGVRVAAEGTPAEEAIIDAGLDFDPGQAYEILVTGAGDDLEATITGTDLRPLAQGQARLRIIHAAPDADASTSASPGTKRTCSRGSTSGTRPTTSSSTPGTMRSRCGPAGRT